MAKLPKVLIFVRHAIAVDAEDWSGSDADRPLTRKGIKKANKVFLKLVAHYHPTRIISSPYLRARETAQLLKDAMVSTNPETSPTPITFTEALTPDASWETWQNQIESNTFAFTPDDIVCVVGHEPSLGLFFCRHIGFPEAIPFKKAGIGVIEPETLTRARLIAFAPARFFKD